MFVDEIVFEIAKKLSGESLSLSSFNPNNQEINKLVDDKIDDIFNYYNKQILYKFINFIIN